MNKNLRFSIFLLFFCAGIAECCEDRMEKPMVLSKEEFYDRYVKSQGVGKEDAFKAIDNSKSSIRFKNDREMKFYNKTVISDYIFVASIRDYESYVWPSGVLSEILDLPYVLTEWSLFEVLKYPKERAVAAIDNKVIGVYLESGYLFNSASEKGAYELALQYSSYLIGLRDSVDDFFEKYKKNEITRKEFVEFRNESIRKRGQIINGDLDYPRRISEAKDSLGRRSNLCGFNSVKPNVLYILAVDYAEDLDGYRLAPGVSIFPIGYKKDFENAIVIRAKAGLTD